LLLVFFEYILNHNNPYKSTFFINKMAGQLYIGREKGLYHASHITPNSSQVYLTTAANGAPILVSELGLINSLSMVPPLVYSQDTQLVFQENANPPITPEVRATVSALVQRLKDDELRIGIIKADIQALANKHR
jgi:hypothetical protein